MRVCGVICEYNPFHHGHAEHLRQARVQSGAAYVVCVMSGPLTQRGAFARHNKWTRARMALACGADLVLELPVRFACAPAPEFAAGGVGLLHALGVVTHLSFGCEPEALGALDEAARLLAQEPPPFRDALHDALAQGASYPRAQALALAQVAPSLTPALDTPNAALALAYLRALPPDIQPVPVARVGGGYHDETLGALPSATAVRAALERGDLPGALAATPCPALLRDAEARGDVHEPEALTQALLYRLRSMDAAALAALPGMDEGLEHRFARAAAACSTRDALILHAKSKRYTYARLSRLCSLALLGETRAFCQANDTPTYARVLGFRAQAAPLLRAIAAHGRVPLVTRAARFDRTQPLFALDVRAQDLWSLGCRASALRVCGRDFTTSPVRVEDAAL